MPKDNPDDVSKYQDIIKAYEVLEEITEKVCISNSNEKDLSKLYNAQKSLSTLYNNLGDKSTGEKFLKKSFETMKIIKIRRKNDPKYL